MRHMQRKESSILFIIAERNNEHMLSHYQYTLTRVKVLNLTVCVRISESCHTSLTYIIRATIP